MNENREEILKLGVAHDSTDAAFRLEVEQVPPADGEAFEDRYYLTSSYIDEEPGEDRKPDRVVTDPGYAFVDFTGLPPGRQYFVQAWRRYPRKPMRDHMACSHSDATTCMTKEATVTVDPAFRTHRFDLTTLDDFTQSWCNRAMHIRCMRDADMGNFIRFDLTGESHCGVVFSRKRFSKDKPIAVRGRVRNTGGPWGALLLYNGDAEDMGISWHVRSKDIRYTVNLPWSPAEAGLITDRIYDFEFRYDPAGRLEYYIIETDGARRLIGTREYKLITDPLVYIGGTNEGGAGSLDFAAIEVDGEETWGFTELNYFWKYENSGAYGGTEWQNGYPQDGSEHFHAQAGYWTLRRNPKKSGQLEYDGIWSINSFSDPDAITEFNDLQLSVSRDGHSFPAGEARMTTSLVRPAPGHSYKSLRLIGSRRSGGELRVYVRDAEGRNVRGLQQRGGIKGTDAATGDEYFCPVYGQVQRIGLTGVHPGRPIYFEAYVMNPNDGVVDPNGWCPPGPEPGEGTDKGPPCLKSLIVDFE